MLLCMRTTVDVPDALLERVRPVLAKRGLTLRAVGVDALERLLAPEPKPFLLRDASAGYTPETGNAVRNAAINEAIDALDEPSR